MIRTHCDLEQDVFRACMGCAGSVAHVDGSIGCALAVPFPCVLLDVLKAAKADHSLVDLASTEWVEAHVKTEGPAEFLPVQEIE